MCAAQNPANSVQGIVHCANSRLEGAINNYNFSIKLYVAIEIVLNIRFDSSDGWTWCWAKDWSTALIVWPRGPEIDVVSLHVNSTFRGQIGRNVRLFRGV